MQEELHQVMPAGVRQRGVFPCDEQDYALEKSSNKQNDSSVTHKRAYGAPVPEAENGRFVVCKKKT